MSEFVKNPIPKGNAKKVAAVITTYYFNSHADVILSRLLGDLNYKPQVEVVSIYCDQFHEKDMCKEQAERCGIPIYPTIKEAIRVGDTGTKIDGVVIIGEHGDYEVDEKGVKHYPRRRLLEETLAALDELNLNVPIFSDKHLSWNIDDTVWMYDELKRRGTKFFGGSSIPWCPHVPAIDESLFKKSKEFFVLSYSTAVEAYGYHAIEVLQSIVEKRAGGETGAKAISAIRGDEVWAAMDRKEWPEDLMLKALEAYSAAHSRAEGHPRDLQQDPVLWTIEYMDGTIGYVLQLRDLIKQWSFAFRYDDDQIAAAYCMAELGRPWTHFARLTGLIEKHIISGEPPMPMERLLMSSGLINYGMDALYYGKKIETTKLQNVKY